MALNGLGTIAHRQQRLAEAEICYKRALLLDPTNEELAENLDILHEATFALTRLPTPDRSLLKSREKDYGRLPSRSGLQSRGSARGRLQSRDGVGTPRGVRVDGPSFLLEDRPSSRDLSNLVDGNRFARASGIRSRRSTPLNESALSALPEFSLGLHGPTSLQAEET